MAEYVNENKPIIFKNETDSDFNVGVGIVFRKSGIYEISINDKTTTVTKILERKTMEDRQVSLKQMLDTIDEMPVMKDNNGMEFIEKSLVKTRIWLLPSAEPEQKTGKWLVDEDGNTECPFCGNTCGFGNYCNECGADLRGENDA